MTMTGSENDNLKPGFERIPYGILSKLIDDAYSFAGLSAMCGEWSPKANPIHMLAFVIFTATGRMDDRVEVTPDGKIKPKEGVSGRKGKKASQG